MGGCLQVDADRDSQLALDEAIGVLDHVQRDRVSTSGSDRLQRLSSRVADWSSAAVPKQDWTA
jgi:hypothetical protein